MPGNKKRGTPPGFRKTSYELTETAKYALEDLVRSLDRDGYTGLSETALLETLIATAKRDGVDRGALDRALRQRRAVLDRAADTD
jgi:hypothetical protein